MRLAHQWELIATNLPPDWVDVRLSLTAEQPAQLDRAAAVLGPLNPGRSGEALVLHVRRAGGAAGPEAVRRLFARLDADRVWCRLEQQEVTTAATLPAPAPRAPETLPPVAESFDAVLAGLPADWSDLLCELELESSDWLPRAALLCAPINPTRSRDTLGFVFRCARRGGYGVSPGMARRCFERLDAERITGSVRVLRSLSDTRPVATQGPVWYVGGKVL
ncbi:MAG TPA: hypothetical protein VFR43_01495 [Gaiellaceae bacterium]|nr:hypothetical protein [Gaiellaceae bacterium]